MTKKNFSVSGENTFRWGYFDGCCVLQIEDPTDNARSTIVRFSREELVEVVAVYDEYLAALARFGSAEGKQQPT